MNPSTSGVNSDEALQTLSENNSDEAHISNETEKNKHELRSYIFYEHIIYNNNIMYLNLLRLGQKML